MSDPQQFFNSQIVGKSNEIYDYSPNIDGSGDFTRLSGIDVLINSIRNLLLTPLGYYPFDPEYGSKLYKMLFEPSDKITQQEIEYEVKNRVQRYDKRIDIQTVQFSWSTDKKTVSVNVVILRNGVTGKVSAVLSQQQSMFGIEDSISAINNISTNNSSNSTSSSNITTIFNSSETEIDFINAMQAKYPMMSLEMITSYWNTLSKNESA
jgi:phage baseplate assembly protein W